MYRSWMFVPGNSERRIEKAKTMLSDVIIYDLEDAVALHEKPQARQMVKLALHDNSNKINFVRVNDPSSSYFPEDLREIMGKGLSGIMLPKAANKEQLAAVDALLTQLESEKDLFQGCIEIVPLIESAIGLYNAYEIASANKRIKRLAFGSVDFTLDINAELTKEGKEILFARSQLVVVSRAARIDPPIDAVFVHLKDHEGILKDARLAKQLGFQGKLVVHPDQIGVVNDVFSPKREEIEEAMVIVNAFEEANSAGSAAIQVGGKMIDYPVAERASRILRQAKIYGLI